MDVLGKEACDMRVQRCSFWAPKDSPVGQLKNTLMTMENAKSGGSDDGRFTVRVDFVACGCAPVVSRNIADTSMHLLCCAPAVFGETLFFSGCQGSNYFVRCFLES